MPQYCEPPNRLHNCGLKIVAVLHLRTFKIGLPQFHNFHSLIFSYYFFKKKFSFLHGQQSKMLIIKLLFICLSDVCLPIVCLSSFCLSVQLFVCLSAYLSVCLSVSPPICLSVRLPVYCKSLLFVLLRN